MSKKLPGSMVEVLRSRKGGVEQPTGDILEEMNDAREGEEVERGEILGYYPSDEDDEAVARALPKAEEEGKAARKRRKPYPTKRVRPRKRLGRFWCGGNRCMQLRLVDQSRNAVDPLEDGDFYCSLCGFQYAAEDKDIFKDQKETCEHIPCRNCSRNSISKGGCPLCKVASWWVAPSTSTPTRRQVQFESSTEICDSIEGPPIFKCNLCFERFCEGESHEGGCTCEEEYEDSCGSLSEDEGDMEKEEECPTPNDSSSEMAQIECPSTPDAKLKGSKSSVPGQGNLVEETGQTAEPTFKSNNLEMGASSSELENEKTSGDSATDGSNGRLPFKCPHCDLSFAFNATLKLHTWAHKTDRYNVEDASSQFQGGGRTPSGMGQGHVVDPREENEQTPTMLVEAVQNKPGISRMTRAKARKEQKTCPTAAKKVKFGTKYRKKPKSSVERHQK